MSMCVFVVSKKHKNKDGINGNNVNNQQPGTRDPSGMMYLLFILSMDDEMQQISM